MKFIYSLFAFTFLFTSCNDGDVITAALEFDDTFKTCGTLVCYKIKTEPSESLSLQLNTTLADLIKTEVDTDNPLLVDLINGNPSFPINATNKFNYRTYSSPIGDNVFCSAIPPSNLGVTNDYTSDEGNALFTIILIEDDNDGIPAEMEDLNGDGNFFNDDTDGDGIPNFLDADDDGDNVLTSTELLDFSGLDTDDNPLTNPEDTDEDGIPNYLDNDDDGDGVLTINEESLTQNLNPADDITNNTVGPDYLNPDVTASVTTTAYRPHIIKQTFQIALTLENIDLPVLTQDVVEFGNLTKTETRTVTPTF